MVGSPFAPGLTRRSIEHLFGLIKEGESEKGAGERKVKVSSYMCELYLDNLVDLYHRMDNGPSGRKERGEGDSLLRGEGREAHPERKKKGERDRERERETKRETKRPRYR